MKNQHQPALPIPKLNFLQAWLLWIPFGLADALTTIGFFGRNGMLGTAEVGKMELNKAAVFFFSNPATVYFSLPYMLALALLFFFFLSFFTERMLAVSLLTADMNLLGVVGGLAGGLPLVIYALALAIFSIFLAVLVWPKIQAICQGSARKGRKSGKMP